MLTAYFHSIGGASGDMILGALVDAGLDPESLNRELRKLPVKGLRISASQGQRAGLLGTHVTVSTPGRLREPPTISQFIENITQSTLEEADKEGAIRILNRLGLAERRAHRFWEATQVLHELGDLDTLVDIVGAVAGLRLLEIQEVFSSPLLAGGGTVQTTHGRIPVPGPATMELIAEAQAPVIPPTREHPTPGELTTPTGAAIITTLASFESPPLAVNRIGYGLGTMDFEEFPNAIGLWIGEHSTHTLVSDYRILETNVDDSTPELLAFAQEQLFTLGALDVWFSPISMKKNRPGVLLSALVPTALEGAASELILSETSTFGVRVRSVERYEAAREVRQINTTLGTVPVKVKLAEGRPIGISPEYEPCRSLALETGLSLAEVFRVVNEAAWKQL
ncbi:MAG: TIGR00299 family protein [SAR202 cluster bacterium Io17-Chloro-G3]|nr:MAG: TIGR00299 family protein [SAR202 cluster bacterium Io17-Chloro-G3]